MAHFIAHRRGERGQTIILVAISIVALIAVSALAIDVVTLYVASSEIKHAADAAALAGAMGIANSGATTLCSGNGGSCPGADPNFLSAQSLAQNMAAANISAILPVNAVAGQTPTPTITYDWSRQGNPLITVALTQSGLPTFFSKIFGRTGSTVSATSVAEVYNPSNTLSPTPIAPTAVKPWLVANADPKNGGAAFINVTTGLIESPTPPLIGEQFDLTADCTGCPLPFANPPGTVNAPGVYRVQYFGASVTANTGNNVCSSSCSGTDFEESVACADMTTVYGCGTGTWSNQPFTTNPTTDSTTGAECLINASGNGLGAGQDTLNNPLPFPSTPPEIIAGSGPFAGSYASTSSSIVTVPIIDVGSGPIPPAPLNIVGFLQAFVNGVETGVSPDPTGGDISITVLNVAGCVEPSSNTNTNPPVVGGIGLSPIPVRLIATP
ncbi:MAG TPA: pilus assembly protein TadG-related protein [Terriglobales bacterium]